MEVIDAYTGVPHCGWRSTVDKDNIVAGAVVVVVQWTCKL